MITRSDALPAPADVPRFPRRGQRHTWVQCMWHPQSGGMASGRSTGAIGLAMRPVRQGFTSFVARQG